MTLCKKHGGDCNEYDAFFLCDVCARSHIDKCKCGGHARYFAEALMCSISCESCDEFVMQVGWDVNIRESWNNGLRGVLDDKL